MRKNSHADPRNGAGEGMIEIPDDFKKIFSNLQEFEKTTKNLVFTANSGGGLVTASVNGGGELIDLKIDESLLEDVESLQILIMSAVNEAHKSVIENQKTIAMQALQTFGRKT